ncbi:hypothetical protein ACQ5BU_001191 [Yersinia enterocolitica]
MKAFLDEISEWKLEAKSEDNERYFYYVNHVDKLISGKRNFVIGRKGTGKTAICEYLTGKSEADYFSNKLTFKSFPFNTLYELKDEGFTAPNRYITLWKLVIYSSVLGLLASNPKINKKLGSNGLDNIKKLISGDTKNFFRDLTAMNFSLSAFDCGLEVGFERNNNGEKVPLNIKVSMLEQFILNHLDESKYMVVFDELDEDYKNINDKEIFRQYEELITGLFKAVQDIRTVFKGKCIFPVVFLRNDIYENIVDPDKNKWDDFKLELEWDKDKIKDLLAFRLSRAMPDNIKEVSFSTAWRTIFSSENARIGTKQSKPIQIFEYITLATHSRPRDYIKYISLCCSKAVGKGYKLPITPEMVKAEEKAYSIYLRNEIIDEISGVLPEIKKILDILSRIRKQKLTVAEFKIEYDKDISNKGLSDKGHLYVLEQLYNFSVIGNQPSQNNSQIFKYQYKESSLNASEKIVLHRGLFKALQII